MPLKMLHDNQPHNSLQHVRHIIGVLGGKGGVGKSTVTVNMALALQRLGKKIGILDADIYGPSVCQLLGIKTFPTKQDEQIIPANADGISVISAAFFDSRQISPVVRAPIANQIIEHFLGNLQWGELDDLLIDFPPGTGDIQITLMQKARITGALVVTTPQEVALLDVRRSVEMCLKMDVPLLGVVENMSYYLHNQERFNLFGEGGGKLLADEFELPFLGQIPIDPEISRSGDEGVSLFETKGVSKESFVEVANRLDKRLSLLEGTFQLLHLELKAGDLVELTWDDKRVQQLRPSTIQRACTCALCEKKEKREVSSEVKIVKWEKMGNYAVQLFFTSGCKKGIFPFKLLRELTE